MFTYWLFLTFFFYCLGDVLSFYEMQNAFWCCVGIFVLYEIFCLWKKRKTEYLLCGLCCFLVLTGGFLAGNGRLKTQKRWQPFVGKRIILQGAVQPDSIKRKEQGISGLLAAEYPLHGKVRIFVKTEHKNADLTVRKLRSEKIRIAGVLNKPVFLRNPGTYDGYLSDKIKGIYGNITVSPVQLQTLREPLPLRFRFTALAQEMREKAVKLKLSPVISIVKDKRVVLIDDSIVRGTTSKKIIKMLRDAGAKEVHMRIASPQIISPCFYGVDISTYDELISAHHSIEEVKEMIGADSLAFLTKESLFEVSKRLQLCVACFTGKYPTELYSSIEDANKDHKF